MKAKVTLKPEDQHDFLLISNTDNMYNALFDLKYNLWNIVKRIELKKDETMVDVILSKVAEIIKDNNLTDDII